jgi:hypothetical protein
MKAGLFITASPQTPPPRWEGLNSCIIGNNQLKKTNPLERGGILIELGI